MKYNIIGAVVAAAIGLVIAFLNYLISKKVLEKSPDKYSVVTIARQLLQVGYLVAAYFAGTKIDFVDSTYLLVGAALGMTIPMFLFTKKLLTVNGTTKTALKEKGKEDASDG